MEPFQVRVLRCLWPNKIYFSQKKTYGQKVNKNYYTRIDIVDVYEGHSNTVHLLYIPARIYKSIHFNRQIILY
jgi:hypothetical protein